MGLFGFIGKSLFGGGKDEPSTPESKLQAPKLPSAQELFDQALTTAKGNFPVALGSREFALNLLQSPEETLQFIEGFQPTDLEQAIANEYFAQRLGEAERRAGHIASQRGIDNLASSLFTEDIGPTILDIGQYLAGLGQTRAAGALNAQLGIDPFSLLNPQVEAGLSQSQAQADMDFQVALAREQNRIQRELEIQQARAQRIGAIGSLLGGGFGAAIGGPQGAKIGSSLGGTASSLFGGTSPVSMGDALTLAQAPETFKSQQMLGDLYKSQIDYLKSSQPQAVFQPTSTQQITPMPMFPSFDQFSILGRG